MFRRVRTLSVAVGACVTAGAAALPATAPALPGDDVRRVGTCTKSSTAKLKLGNENGRIKIEFEVDQNRRGVRWTYALFRNGKRAATGARRTRAPSGAFTVRRLVRNGPGRDRISARASRWGETCRVNATF